MIVVNKRKGFSEIGSVWHIYESLLEICYVCSMIQMIYL